MGRIVLAAPHSGSGKTTVTMGILRALASRGHKIQPFKVGPDYIDTAYHARICGRTAINLDAYLLSELSLKQLFAENDTQELSVIEGVMGLYDGLGSSSEASTAQVASWIKAPIVIVLDARGMAGSAAAILAGLRDFGNANVRAVIFNKISGDNHYQILKSAAEKVGIKSLGYFPAEKELFIESRQLGIMPESELSEAEKKIDRMGELAATYIELDELIDIAYDTQPLDIQKLEINPICGNNKPKIAIALDKAFNFYYADNLRLLERFGAELIYFSPLKDPSLPNCDGVYIGGGFPEIFAADLAGNERMRKSILGASLENIPIYAECGGYMYLMETLNYEGKEHAMCGVFAGSAELSKRLSRRFGYINSELLQNTPIAPAGYRYRNHEFHHSEISSSADPAYSATKVSSGLQWQGGHVLRNTFATYAHSYFRSDIAMAEYFVKSCMHEK